MFTQGACGLFAAGYEIDLGNRPIGTRIRIVADKGTIPKADVISHWNLLHSCWTDIPNGYLTHWRMKIIDAENFF